jgi:hypothetical protein
MEKLEKPSTLRRTFHANVYHKSHIIYPGPLKRGEASILTP